MSNWQEGEKQAQLREGLVERCKTAIVESASRFQMAGSTYGETVKNWLDTTNRSAILGQAAEELAAHIERSTGAYPDCFSANHYLQNALSPIGTWENEDGILKFKTRR